MALLFHRESTNYCYSFNDFQAFENWATTTKNICGMAFVGRSNVGKSTLINAIFGKKVSRTSKTPGRTRSINVFSFGLFDSETKTVITDKRFYFFDLPGYGFAQVSKEMSEQWNQLMHSFFKIMPESVLIMNLQDARHPDQKSDQEFKQYIEKTPAPVTLVFNKYDKLRTQKERAELNKTVTAMKENYKKIEQFHLVSAENRLGVEKLEESIISFIKVSSQI